MKKKNKKTTAKAGEVLLNELKNYGIGFYLFAVFMGLPLYIYNKYWEMAIHKWQIYLVSTLVFAGFILCFQVYEAIEYITKGEKRKELLKCRSFTDGAVVVYLLISVLSFGFAMDKMAAWMGASGWYMGIIAQILFGITYIIFRNVNISGKLLWGMHGITSGFCCFYAICQRYGKDWMYLYWDMPDEVVRDYISTIGNRTWFSAYLCVAFPIGMFWFWQSRDKWTRRGLVVYLLLLFHGMLVTSSDSIYMAFAAVIWVLVLFSVGKVEKIRRLVEILLLWFGSCLIAVAVHSVKAEFPKGLRGISGMLVDGRVVIPGLVLSLLIWLVLFLPEKVAGKNKQGKSTKGILLKGWEPKKIRKWQKILMLLSVLAGVLVVVFVVLNTTGRLQEWFGVTIQNKYLMFNDNWGDQRGHTWKLTVQMFKELPWYRKLIGVGPDSYALYAYSTPEFTEALQQVWGTSIMTNAHNEWLNSLLCYGILGGVAYLAIFLGGACETLVKVDLDKVNPLVPGIGLCAIAYVCHNFFCYQQVCVTPLMFILLGLAIGLKEKCD